ncbi:MFS transporter [Cupriavidus sp. TA19]|uniref:Bug family tripartite tricarboxylate transporter substrate binding protein n=1 Tax=unclassified Cupriavidus TaxID=2640874 RepID=UPI000E2E46ED|nr:MULTISPECIES: tripartite tricarboxylate transporter substrate binding protein [unclassified Cupriavidus]BDB29986.1 tripartite tricarboxylate transporter substrate binding protein [Cupriavidus sp. P-10]GLC97998.1 MFS transporter [Cupriavidus sp. TA19]
MHRTRFCRSLASTITSILLATTMHGARADAHDTPMKLVVIVAPGGSGDAVARLVAAKLTGQLGRPVIVENKPGAGGNLATQTIARSAPDGASLLVSSNNHTINPTLYADAGYKIDDLKPVAILMRGPSVIVVPANSPYTSLQALIDAAKARPDTIAYGSAGIGTPSHIAGELFARAAGIRLVHAPYRGSGPSLSDVAGGQIPVAVATLVAARPLIKAGKVRALAVTSKHRWPGAESIPAASETGMPEYEHLTWLALFAPKGTSPEVVNRLNKATSEALADREVKRKITELGGEVDPIETTAVKAFIDADYAVSTQLVRSAGLRAN